MNDKLKKGKGLITEFKEFVLRGNVMDLAVGVIIGAAFGSIIAALTDDFINPLIASIGGVEVAGMIKLPWVDYSGLDSEAVKALALNYGHFITTIINFLITALCIFIMVKIVNKIMSIGKKEVEEAPTTKTCPYCKSEIDINASKCPHCTSDVPENVPEE